MARLTGETGKKLIQIDVCSDIICPWCFVGKRNMDKAIASSLNLFDFEVRWYPFFMRPSPLKEGVDKRNYYGQKFGSKADQFISRISEAFKDLGAEYNMLGLTGNSLDSQRLVYFAGLQSFNRQHSLVEKLFVGHFVKGRPIGDREFLVQSATKSGVEGAAEFLENPNNGHDEVLAEFKQQSALIAGVPLFKINKRHKLSGVQPPEVFMRTFLSAGSKSYQAIKE